jgi:hypothetical protein
MWTWYLVGVVVEEPNLDGLTAELEVECERKVQADKL